jgi:hypothetical protein
MGLLAWLRRRRYQKRPPTRTCVDLAAPGSRDRSVVWPDIGTTLLLSQYLDDTTPDPGHHHDPDTGTHHHDRHVHSRSDEVPQHHHVSY